MKTGITIIILIICINTLKSQVAVGKTSIDGSGLLDFNSGTTNGILLPIVETLPASGAAATNGTVLMDSNDQKIKIRENNIWKDLTDAGSIAGIALNTTAETGGGVIIGAASSSAQGVLVLESSNKALILPKINDPVSNVIRPRAGMLCYDTVSKTVAVFDGLKWNFWK